MIIMQCNRWAKSTVSWTRRYEAQSIRGRHNEGVGNERDEVREEERRRQMKREEEVGSEVRGKRGRDRKI